MTAFEKAVAGVLNSLQPGDVVTYGEVATEAGWPGAARRWARSWPSAATAFRGGES